MNLQVVWQHLLRLVGDPCRVDRDFSAFAEMSDAELSLTYDELSRNLSTMLTDRYRRLSLFLAMKWRQEHLPG